MILGIMSNILHNKTTVCNLSCTHQPREPFAHGASYTVWDLVELFLDASWRAGDGEVLTLSVAVHLQGALEVRVHLTTAGRQDRM